MAQIRITPEELREGSSFLLQKMEAVVGEVNESKSKVDAVAAEWEGAAQNSFVAAFESMLPTLQKDFPEIIEGISTQLTVAADTLEEADNQISQSFAANQYIII